MFIRLVKYGNLCVFGLEKSSCSCHGLNVKIELIQLNKPLTGAELNLSHVNQSTSQ